MSGIVANPLEDSLFAARVVRTIRVGGQFDDLKRELFKLVLNYILAIENGKGKSRGTGKIISHPIESLVAYRKALDVISSIPCDDEKNEKLFNDTLNNVKSEVESSLRENNISKERLNTTYKYFKQSRRLALREMARKAMRREEPSLIENFY